MSKHKKISQGEIRNAVISVQGMINFFKCEECKKHNCSDTEGHARALLNEVLTQLNIEYDVSNDPIGGK